MKKKLLYWIPTGLLLLAVVGPAIGYFVDIEATAAQYAEIGYPSQLLYFNGIAKILGGIAIAFPISPVLREWAYAGYFYIFLLASQALYFNMPEMLPVMLIFFVLWGLSYWQYRVQFAK